VLFGTHLVDLSEINCWTFYVEYFKPKIEAIVSMHLLIDI